MDQATFDMLAADSGVSEVGKFCAQKVLVENWPCSSTARKCFYELERKVTVAQVSRWAAQIRQLQPRGNHPYLGMQAAFQEWWDRRVVRCEFVKSKLGTMVPARISAMTLRADYSRWRFWRGPSAPEISAGRFGSLMVEAGANQGADVEVHANLTWYAGIALRLWPGEDWEPPKTADELVRLQIVVDAPLIEMRADMLMPHGDPVPNADGSLPEPCSATVPPEEYGFVSVPKFTEKPTMKNGYGFAPTKKKV